MRHPPAAVRTRQRARRPRRSWLRSCGRAAPGHVDPGPRAPRPGAPAGAGGSRGGARRTGDQRHRPQAHVAAYGLEVEIGPGLDDLIAVARGEHGAAWGEALFPDTWPRIAVPRLASFARDWTPDVVVSEEEEYAGLLLAELLGVPAVTHSWPSPCRPAADRRQAVAAMAGVWGDLAPGHRPRSVAPHLPGCVPSTAAVARGRGPGRRHPDPRGHGPGDSAPPILPSGSAPCRGPRRTSPSAPCPCSALRSTCVRASTP